MSALDNLGPHLLGRVPSTPDVRDYQLEHFLSTSPLDQALAALQKSHAARATKDWAKIVTRHPRRHHACPPRRPRSLGSTRTTRSSTRAKPPNVSATPVRTG